MLVETKNGDSYDGILEGADAYMNLRLKDVLVTAGSTLNSSKHPRVYIRGNNIKSIQLPPDIIENHIANMKKKRNYN